MEPAQTAGIHVRKVFFLQGLAGVGVDRQAGAGRQHRVQAEGQAGRVDHFLDLGRDGLGHTHTAEQRVAAHAHPAAFGVGVVGFNETGWGPHRAVVPVAALFVGGAAERRNGPGGDLAGFFQHGHGRVGIDNLGQPGQLRPLLGHVEDFIQYEAHVAQRRFIVSHDNLSLVGSGRSRGTATLGLLAV